MFETNAYVKYVIAICLIMLLTFMSQDVGSRQYAGLACSFATSQISACWQKTASWTMSNIVPKISGEVSKGGEAVKALTNTKK